MAALTFHHSSEEEKNYEIAKISLRIENIQELTDDMFLELEKCELLCSNCHREKHIDINKIDIQKIYNQKSYKETQKKVDREIVYNMFFNENLAPIEISKILNYSNNTISEIIKEEKIRRN